MPFMLQTRKWSNIRKIKQLTYREMRELSYSGFSVFHDEALQPAFSAGIPVVVKNTNNPSAPGTSITRTKPENKQIVSGIASSTGFMSIYIGKYLMNREVGFGRRVLPDIRRFQLELRTHAIRYRRSVDYPARQSDDDAAGTRVALPLEERIWKRTMCT